MIPGTAAGKMTCVAVSQRDIPSAKPPSRCEVGIARSDSSTFRVINGKLNTVSAKAPDRTEKPRPNCNTKIKTSICFLKSIKKPYFKEYMQLNQCLLTFS